MGLPTKPLFSILQWPNFGWFVFDLGTQNCMVELIKICSAFKKLFCSPFACRNCRCKWKCTPYHYHTKQNFKHVFLPQWKITTNCFVIKRHYCVLENTMVKFPAMFRCVKFLSSTSLCIHNFVLRSSGTPGTLQIKPLSSHAQWLLKSNLFTGVWTWISEDVPSKQLNAEQNDLWHVPSPSSKFALKHAHLEILMAYRVSSQLVCLGGPDWTSQNRTSSYISNKCHASHDVGARLCEGIRNNSVSGWPRWSTTWTETTPLTMAQWRAIWFPTISCPCLQLDLIRGFVSKNAAAKTVVRRRFSRLKDKALFWNIYK